MDLNLVNHNLMNNDLFNDKVSLEDVLDPAFQERVQADPRSAFASWGMDVPQDVDVRVHVNTDDTFYLAFPPDPNVALSDEALGVVAGGGKTASSVGSVSSASSLGSIPSTASTGGSASSMASLGTAS